MSPKMLSDIARKLGIRSENIIKKSAEFMRILHTKHTCNTQNDMATSILCLDLATGHLGHSFNKKMAQKLCGLRHNIYTNRLHLMEKILDLERTKTIANLCVQFQCVEVRQLAEEVFSKYKSQWDQKDLTHPQYMIGAIYMACKLKGFKIHMGPLINASHLRKSQWKRLVKEFERIVPMDSVTKSINNMENNTISEVNNNNSICVEVEDYEVWRERILREAYANL